MAMDISGGVFSTISLVFRPTFDVLAASSYLVVVACDVTIVLLHFVLKKRHAHVIEEILVIEAHEAGEAIPVHELTTSEELLFSDHPHST